VNASILGAVIYSNGSVYTEPFSFGVSLSQLIYIDESGDLGWSFDYPYGQRGSSRFLTIAAMILPDSLDHLPERKVRQLYTHGKWDTKREKKWVDLSPDMRLTFAKNAVSLINAKPDISYKAIVVDKRNVNGNFRRDSNKLYNYMLRLLLLDEIAKYPQVTLIPDPRSIKVQDGKSLHHYLEMLLYEKQALTNLETIALDSKASLNLQFVDMLAGVLGTHFEFGKSEPWNLLSSRVEVKRLFF
jgi:hypothetical protein